MNARSVLTILMVFWCSVTGVQAGSLRGTVSNSADLSPLSGAAVTVHVLLPDSIPFPTVTAPDGSYEINGIIPDNGIYVVIAWKTGFRESYTRVADLGSQDLLFDILLEPDTAGLPPPGGGGDSGIVSGTILQVGAGGALEGVADASVTLHAAGGATVTSSGSDGRYAAMIPAGPYAVSVTGPGFDSMAVTGLAVDSLGATVNAVVKKTVTATDDDGSPLPAEYELSDAFPNPFNPTTTITYAVPERGNVRIAIFNSIGGIVADIADGVVPAGRHHAMFDASGLPGGAYFLRMQSGDFIAVRKLLLVK